MKNVRKALVIGEYSGIGATICTALKSKSARIIHVSDSDGFKEIASTADVSISKQRWYGFFAIYFLIRHKIDLVIFCSPATFSLSPTLSLLVGKIAKRKAKKCVLLGCTSDAIYWFARHPLVTCEHQMNSFKNAERMPKFISRSWLKTSLWFGKNVDRVITVTPEYSLMYTNLGIKNDFWPLPSSLIRTSISKVCPDKPKILTAGHVVNKRDKGSDVVKKLECRKTKSPYNLIVVSRIPYKAFIEWLDRCDVYIDQLHSPMYGYATIQALWYCPCVISGNDPAMSQQWSNLTGEMFECPVINCDGSVASLEKAILEAQLKISVFGRQRLIEENRNFVEQMHNLDRWKRLWE